MNTNKILMGAVAGCITFFLLGWLIYGFLLRDFMAGEMPAMATYEKNPPDFWALILGNLSSGFMLALIFGYWGNIKTTVEGIKAGLIIGVLIGCGFDFVMYGTSTMMTLKSVLVDIAINGIMVAIGGGVVATVLGMGKEAKA